MSTFKNFELNNSEMIFGGDILPTAWSDGTNQGTDGYDQASQRIFYFD